MRIKLDGDSLGKFFLLCENINEVKTVDFLFFAVPVCNIILLYN